MIKRVSKEKDYMNREITIFFTKSSKWTVCQKRWRSSLIVMKRFVLMRNKKLEMLADPMKKRYDLRSGTRDRPSLRFHGRGLMPREVARDR